MNSKSRGLVLSPVCFVLCFIVMGCDQPKDAGWEIGSVVQAVCKGVQLTASPANFLAPDSTVMLTASRTNCGKDETPEYRFSSRYGSGPEMELRGWNTSPSVVFGNHGLPDGRHAVTVFARNVGSNVASDSSATYVVYSGARCSINSFEITPNNTFTSAVLAAPTFCPAGEPELEFYYRPFETGTTAPYTLIRSWAGHRVTWDIAGLLAGKYEVQVRVRMIGKSNAYDDAKNAYLTIVNDCTDLSLTASPPSAQQIGSDVMLTARAVCSKGSPVFKFRYFAPGETPGQPSGLGTLIKDWSGDTAAVWKTNGLPSGTYTLQADIKAQSYRASVQLRYTLTAAPTDGIAFADPHVEAAVRTKLNIPTGPITQAAADTLTDLDLRFLGVTNLGGLEHLHNLTDLRAPFNQIASGAPLAGLTKLTYLELEGNALTGTLAPFSALTQLVYLDVSDNQLTGPLSPLAALTQLVELHASTNQLNGDVSSLSGLTALQVLSLFRNQMTGLAGISALGALKSLQLQLNPLVGDLSPLVGATNLEDLQLWQTNGLTGDLTPLASLLHLQRVGMQYNQLRGDLSPLSGLRDLREIDFAVNPISGTLEPLAGLTELRQVVLFQTQIGGKLDPLTGLLGLEVLLLDNNQIIGTLEPLARLTNLTHLRVTGNQLEGNLSPLAGLTNLSTSLEFSMNKLGGDLSPLAGLTKLDTLLGEGNQLIGGLAPLANLTQLTQLALPANQLTGDLSALNTLGKLTHVELNQNQLTGDLAALGSWTDPLHVFLSGNSLTIDLAPAVQNAGFAAGDSLDVGFNTIDCVAQAGNIATLQARGVNLTSGCP